MKINLPTLLCALLLTTSVSLAQKPGNDGPVGIFRNGQEYNQFMGDVKSTLNGTPEMESMVLMINDAVLNQPFGSSASKYGGNNSMLGLLSNADIRKDLEMVDRQYEELKTLNDEIQKRMAEQLRALDFSNAESLREQLNSIRNSAKKELNSVLLPHQLKRLNQLKAQQRLRFRSLVDVITSEPVKSDLAITDKQEKLLRKEEREIQEELQRQIAKLRNEAKQRILSRLQPGQKQEVVEMFGDFFDFESEPIQSTQKRSKERN